jgi:hypothetical protein
MAQTFARPTHAHDRVGHRVLLLAAAAALCVCATGCYERVTRARGFGADNYQVAEPYYEDNQIDTFLYGERSSTGSRGSLLNR